jgi:DNA-binding NarL/FixJ family response regulator
MIHVLLVDDHTSFRQPLAFIMEREADLTVVAQVGSVEAARYVLMGFDVAVVDLGLPDGHGVDLIRDLCTARPNLKVLVLTSSSDQREYARAIEAGARGVMRKSAGIREIIEQVRCLGCA